jgi:hypothetical protein
MKKTGSLALETGKISWEHTLLEKTWLKYQGFWSLFDQVLFFHTEPVDCPVKRGGFHSRGFGLSTRIIFYATNLTQPRFISHMFGTWLNNQHKDCKPLIWVGVAAICWAI